MNANELLEHMRQGALVVRRQKYSIIRGRAKQEFYLQSNGTEQKIQYSTLKPLIEDNKVQGGYFNYRNWSYRINES